MALVPALLHWFAENARALPWRSLDEPGDPYAIWVSEIMLQQTRVETVRPYWERWMRSLPTIRALANARPEQLHKLWEGLGYYTRVRNLQKAAQIIVQEHAGRFPETLDELLDLPGIGRYTAGAICSIAFDQPTPVLDGNVMRVLTRIFGVGEDPRERRTNDRLWNLAQSLVLRAKLGVKPGRVESRVFDHRPNLQSSEHPLSWTQKCGSGISRPASALNQSLMELGALICTPRKPKCASCPVERQCAARRRNCVDHLPNLRPRPAARPRRFAAFVLRKKGRILVRQRSAGVVNAHLWEFPNAELTGTRPDVRSAARDSLGFIPREIEPLCTIQHSITRYRITLEAFTVGGIGIRKDFAGRGRWLGVEELKRLSFPSAHKRILAFVGESSPDSGKFGCNPR